jgi:phage shock protein A/DNA-binding XRE family transcriptional regulator
MGYRLQIHHEIRDWLTGLRAAEPELARLVGEAVLALLDAGETLGPPLVVPLESVLRPPDDPRENLDYAYQRRLETLAKVRRGVADVATSRKRVELASDQLEQQAAKLASQHRHALAAGNDDLASEAGAREAGIRERLFDLRRQLHTLAEEEERLSAASQRLQIRVEAFRVQKETIKARYTAAEGSERVREAFASTDADTSDLEDAETETDARSGMVSACTDADELLQEIRDVTPSSRGGPGSADEDDIEPPPGLMELRPGAPDGTRAAVLFVFDAPDTVILVGRVEDPGGSAESYREVLQMAADRLEQAHSGRLPDGAPAPDAFISYATESFLDEFFPGEETEVEIGAGVLVARNRAHTLAEARQRMRLTQAQVADRMNVRQERVSAIERAEPGATEVRTLAAYVRALGGRLEIIADIGGERIVLR